MTGKLKDSEGQNRPETYLCLQLSAETPVVIPMRADRNRRPGDNNYHIQEVLTLAIERLTPLPVQPRWVMGLLNQRGRIFGVIDLADFLGLPPLTEEDRNPGCAILQVERRAIALGVRQVKGILRMSPDRVRSVVGKVSPALETYLQGCISPDDEDSHATLSSDDFLVIDPIALVHGAIERRDRIA